MMARAKENLNTSCNRQRGSNLLRGENRSASNSSRNSLVAGLGMAGVSAAAKFGVGPAFAQDRPLTPTFYQWIEDLHPGFRQVNAQFPGINYQIAPVEGFGIERFVAEAKNKESTWDVYVGQTPFVEMSAMVAADVIEPWDNYIPKDVLDDIIPSIREENLIDGKMYGWPFLLDVIGTGWHSGLTTTAKLPMRRPRPGTNYLANAKAIDGFRRSAVRRDLRLAWLAVARPDDAQHEHATSTRRKACSTSPANRPSKR